MSMCQLGQCNEQESPAVIGMASWPGARGLTISAQLWSTWRAVMTVLLVRPDTFVQLEFRCVCDLVAGVACVLGMCAVCLASRARLDTAFAMSFSVWFLVLSILFTCGMSAGFRPSFGMQIRAPRDVGAALGSRVVPEE